MAADTDHAKDVIGRAERHQRRLQSALAVLTRRIVQLLGEAPLRDGQLYDLQWAVNARTTIAQLVQEEYLSEIDDIKGLRLSRRAGRGDVTQLHGARTT